MGITSIMKSFSAKRKLGFVFKAAALGAEHINVIPPDDYARRFYNFIDYIIN